MNIQGLRHLRTSLARVDYLTQWAIARAQAAGQDPTNALHGLVITDDEVSAHLANKPLAGLWAAAGEAGAAQFADYLQTTGAIDKWEATEGAESPLPRLVRAFDLTALDRDILLICLAPELDRRYERLFAYLQNDVSKPRPTINLVMNLLGSDLEGRFEVWERLAPEALLRARQLIEISADPGQAEPILLGQQLRIARRVLMHLLGSAEPDARLFGAVQIIRPGDAPFAAPLATKEMGEIDIQASMVYVQGQNVTDRRLAAAALCAEVDLPLVYIDLARLRTLEGVPFALAWQLAMREAQLVEAAVMFEGWDASFEEMPVPPGLWERLLDDRRPVFLCGEKSWEPRGLRRARRMLRVELAMPQHARRLQIWEHVLAEYPDSDLRREQLDELVGKFRMTPGQIIGAVHTAADFAASRAGGGAIRIDDLYAGARAHCSAKLGDLAKKVKTRFDWDELILPDDRKAQLREMVERARYGDRVHDDWGFGAKIAPERGLSALFAGESGTGKTLAASVIAQELGLELYKIDLSGVVSKYIGETEKNLRVIFDEARTSNAILFFDEADALFGKRSEVKDAHDRYANIETAYLLQQIESYDGITVLATNLRQNLDEAFTRRLDFLIDFPFPDAADRRRIWEVNFPPEAPVGPDVDLDLLAERYRLAGGNIRNATVASAYLAAADGSIITMTHLLHAIRREHQKMGRLIDEELETGRLARR
ncbi:MAG: ATP-binding protein [Anaerolineae bacterium]|nr:ATP-binding protein [Anaerolineae bacterium]